MKSQQRAKLARNRQLLVGPLGRLSQGTSYRDAAGRDGPTQRSRGQRESQVTRHKLKLERAQKDGWHESSSL